MRKGHLALGVLLAMPIAGAARAHQPTPVTGRVTSADLTAKTLTVETPTGEIPFKADGGTISGVKLGDRIRVTSTGSERGQLAAIAKTVSGSVASVDVSESQVTIDMPNGSPALKSINTGDPVRIQVGSAARIAERIDVLSSGAQGDGVLSMSGNRARRSLGLWLLAMTGTAVVLRSRRPRTI